MSISDAGGWPTLCFSFVCTTTIEVAPPFAVFKGWVSRTFALGSTIVKSDESPVPDKIKTMY